MNELNILINEADKYVSETGTTHGRAERVMAIGEVLSRPESRDEILRRVDARLRKPVLRGK